MSQKRSRRMTWAYYLAAILVLWIAVRLISGAAKPGHELGVHQGRLAPCPQTPNCVSTQATDEAQRMEPLIFEPSIEDPLADVAAVIDTMPRSRVVTHDGNYLHAEFQSLLFGFVDDVEFLVDRENARVEFRSASRVGYSDLGANRKRMQEIRRKLSAFWSDETR
ncbi:MAG: DUF1499 domain-containing protein [Pirellulales bacterium]|nr:DUF1499 domain-containing protein [Pirellulales bacterium]